MFSVRNVNARRRIGCARRRWWRREQQQQAAGKCSNNENRIDASSWKIDANSTHLYAENVSPFSVCTKEKCWRCGKFFVHIVSTAHFSVARSLVRIDDDVTDAQNASATKAQCSGRISLILRLPKRMPMHFPHNHTVSARLALSLSPSFCSLLAQHRLVMQVYARVHRNAKKGSNCSECRTHALCRWSKVSIRCSLRLHWLDDNNEDEPISKRARKKNNMNSKPFLCRRSAKYSSYAVSVPCWACQCST